MTLRLSAAVLAVFAAGCAPTAPASPAAARALPTAPLATAYDVPPVEAPNLPVALRSGLAPAAMPMDHAAASHADPADGEVDHAAMGHMMPGTDLTPTALAPSLDAYLALHAALVADDLAAGQAAAAALAAAVVQTDLGPEIQAHAADADAATDLDGLRAAFGRLGPPVIALVEAVGAPPGRELSAFRCGMADAPQDGVWIQATADIGNPLLAGMKACGRRTGAVGVVDESGSEGHEHGAHDD